MESSEDRTGILHQYERDRLFLQVEHAITIRALHREIDKLRRQCSDLQFQLVFHGISPSREDTLAAQVEELTEKVEEQSHRDEQLKLELEQQKELIKQLEQDLAQQKERYGQDVGARNLIIVKLRREVREKNRTITDLLASLSSRGGGGGLRSSSHPDSSSPPASDAGGVHCATGRRLLDKYWTSSERHPVTDELVVELQSDGAPSVQLLPGSGST